MYIYIYICHLWEGAKRIINKAYVATKYRPMFSDLFEAIFLAVLDLVEQWSDPKSSIMG